MPKKNQISKVETEKELIERLNKKYGGDKIIPYMGNESLPSHKSQIEYDEDRIKVIVKCSQDILYFAENFFYIINLDEGKQLISLHDFQTEALKRFTEFRKAIMCCSRQVGKTTLLTIYALWLCTFFKHQRVVIVANKENTAQEILKRIKLAYEELPNWFKPTVKNWGKTQVEFGNDCSIQISATSADAIRGKAVNALIIDEMAFIDDGIVKEFWSAVYPTISSSKKAKVLIASTPNSVGNKFHDLWEQSHVKNSGWTSLEVPWSEIPGKDDEWANEERIALGDDLFEQEYNCKFLQSGEGAISNELHKELETNCYSPRITLYDGAYKIYREPNAKERFYVAGVDVGDGIGKAASTINILDITDLFAIEQVATYHSRDVGVFDFSTRLNDILKQWGKPPVAIERNQMGSSVITQMDKHFNYPHIVDFSQKQGGYDYSHLRGITSATNTKHHGVTNLFYWLKSKQVVVLHDKEYLNEFKTFIRHKNNRWSKRSGDNIWDDRIDALIWSLVVLHDSIIDKFYTVVLRDGNKRPQEIKPLYENYMNDATFYGFGTEENNWGVAVGYLPDQSYEDMANPEMAELNQQGWFVPGGEDERLNGSWSYGELY